MPKPATLLLLGLTFMQVAAVSLYANDQDPLTSFGNEKQESIAEKPTAPFEAFTGKVIKNKVRLRLQPNLDGPILKELNQGDLLIVVGETDDFYAVQPTAGIKAYVFRTYILDNVVEANRVNVRLEPDTDAPVLAQLSAGDRIEGTVSTQNNKWLEVTPPASSRLYVSKDYIEKIGNPSMMSAIEKRREEANLLLNSTSLASQEEMQKTYPEINLDGVYANFNKIINAYQDFPEQVARAKDLLSTLQDDYTKKKISYLESKARNAQDDWQTKNSQLNEQVKTQQQRLAQLEQQLKHKNNKGTSGQANALAILRNSQGVNDKMATWLPIEQAFYEAWSEQNGNRSNEEFYSEQQQQAIALRGLIEPYTRVIKNKPGDYVLLNTATHLPIAYLYSTQVNLQDRVGQEVTIYVVERPNNHFAFPAYFVFTAE